MYFPEGNALVALEDHDTRSGTPGYKSIPVRLSASHVAQPGDPEAIDPGAALEDASS